MINFKILLATNTYAYDGFARQTAATDGRGNTSRISYNSFGQVDYTENAASNRTAYAYDELGRQVAVASPLSNTVFTAYDSLGNVIRTWGATYPVEYGYDTRGRKISMKTFRVENGNGDETRWLYDNVTGLLTNKVYADGMGTAYAYTDTGRLHTRTWARGVATGYAYDTLGQLTNTVYSDSTPCVAYTYDRLGRMTAAVTAVSTNLFTYSGFDLVSETQNGKTLERSYDPLGRPALIYCAPADVWGYYSSERLYDDYGRLATVQSHSPYNDSLEVQYEFDSVFDYTYLAGTATPQSMTAWYGNDYGYFDQTLFWTRSYEPHRDLIAAVSNYWNTATVSSYSYANDALGRRTARTDCTGTVYSANSFRYNNRSEVTNAVMGTDTYGYSYDPIGNRIASTANGSETDYLSNPLNQYVAVSNQQAAVSSPSYDLDGNMLTCSLPTGDWRFFWDAENRLICASNAITVVRNTYDHQSRRIAKTTATETQNFLYDGWNLVAETVQAPNQQPVTWFYTWGLDLSGSQQGAGGVGGLLAVHSPYCVWNEGELYARGETYYPAYDANGNVTAYFDTVGTTAGAFEYDAFGNTTAMSGDLVLTYCFRFSTVYHDNETGLDMFQFRPYIAPLGRWAKKDESKYSIINNDYIFSNNNPLDYEEKGVVSKISGDEESTYETTVNGSTTCGLSTWPTWMPMKITINNTKCTKGCTKEHEQQHASDLKPCCVKAREAFQKTQVNKVMVANMWNNYVTLARAWTECRAYGVSISCADTLLKNKNCNCPKPKDKTCCADVNAYKSSAQSQKTSYCGMSGSGSAPACPF